MNKVFKIVFSRVKGMFVVGSEHISSHGKKSVKAAVAAVALGVSLASLSGSAMAEEVQGAFKLQSGDYILFEGASVDKTQCTSEACQGTTNKDLYTVSGLGGGDGIANTGVSGALGTDNKSLTITVTDTEDDVSSDAIDLSGLQTTQGNTNAENIKTNAENISKLESQTGEPSTPKTYELGAGPVFETDEEGNLKTDGNNEPIKKENIAQITLTEKGKDTPDSTVNVIGDGSVVTVSYDKENGAIKITGTDNDTQYIGDQETAGNKTTISIKNAETEVVAGTAAVINGSDNVKIEAGADGKTAVVKLNEDINVKTVNADTEIKGDCKRFCGNFKI